MRTVANYFLNFISRLDNNNNNNNNNNDNNNNNNNNSNTNVKHWNLLFNFASMIFAKPGRSSQINSLSSIIKKRTINYITNIPDQASIPCMLSSTSSQFSR